METKRCVNCFVFSWPQLEERGGGQVQGSQPDAGAEKMKICGKCKFVYYCSRQCQEEHWEKVHRVQCKFLAGRKSVPSNSHEPASCHGCQQESSYTRGGVIPTATTALARPDNPDYGCGVAGYIKVCEVFRKDFGDGGRFSAPLPFPLADMTGQFRTRAEHCVALVQRLNYKLQITGHPLQGIVIQNHAIFRGHPASFYFDIIMAMLRVKAWSYYWQAVPGAMTDRLVVNAISSCAVNLKICGHLEEVLRQLDVHNPAPRHPDSYSICDCLLLVFNMAFSPYHRMRTLATLEAVLPRDVQELVAHSGPVEKMEGKVDEVLRLLSTGLVPMVQILKVLCDGQLEQPCSSCSTLATISSLFTRSHCPAAVISRGKAFVTFAGLGGSFYSCGKAACSKDVIAKLQNKGVVLGTTSEMVEKKFGKVRCDNCDLVAMNGHRCSKCLTKLYCSKECQLQDYKIHEKLCREGEVERKRKGERREREEQGRRESAEAKEEIRRDVETRLGQSPNPVLQALLIEFGKALEKISVE